MTQVHLRTASWVNPDGNTLNAIKLTSKATYAEGLYLWDIARMPQVYVSPMLRLCTEQPG